MIQPIILAAGKGTRMRSTLPKVLHKVNGKPMLRWVLDALPADYLEPIIVIGHGADEVREEFPNNTFVVQENLSGTATAVAAALPHVTADTVVILYGDQPFVSTAAIVALGEKAQSSALVLATTEVPHFDNWYQTLLCYGRVIVDEGGVKNIVEYKDASDDERALRLLNAGICGVQTAWLRHALPAIEPSPTSGEYYFTALPSITNAEGNVVNHVEVSPIEAYGVNSPEDLQQAELLYKSQFEESFSVEKIMV